MLRYKHIRPLEVNVKDIVIRKSIEEWLDTRLTYVHEHENESSIDLTELEFVLVFMVRVGLMDKQDARKYLDYLNSVEEKFEICEEKN